MNKRKNQQQIWADKFFLKKLEDIRAKRVLAGKPPIKSVGDLTKIICETDAFKKLEEELINFDPLNKSKNNNRSSIKIRFDGGFF